MGGRDIVLENVSKPCEQRFNGVAAERFKVASSLHKSCLDHVGKVHSALKSLVQQSLCDHVKVRAKSVEQFPFGRLVALFGSIENLLGIEEHSGLVHKDLKHESVAILVRSSRTRKSFTGLNLPIQRLGVDWAWQIAENGGAICERKAAIPLREVPQTGTFWHLAAIAAILPARQNRVEIELCSEYESMVVIIMP